jgi:hypothetical protein
LALYFSVRPECNIPCVSVRVSVAAELAVHRLEKGDPKAAGNYSIYVAIILDATD